MIAIKRDNISFMVLILSILCGLIERSQNSAFSQSFVLRTRIDFSWRAETIRLHYENEMWIKQRHTGPGIMNQSKSSKLVEVAVGAFLLLIFRDHEISNFPNDWTPGRTGGAGECFYSSMVPSAIQRHNCHTKAHKRAVDVRMGSISNLFPERRNLQLIKFLFIYTD